MERFRRGKAHRAKGGAINVLGGALFGCRYIRKTEGCRRRLRDRRTRDLHPLQKPASAGRKGFLLEPPVRIELFSTVLVGGSNPP